MYITAVTTEILFPKADTDYLKSVARGIGLEINVPRDIREAQALKDKGVPVPGDLDPEEAYLLLEIAKKIQSGSTTPEGFAIYLNDRGVTDIPEDVPTLVKRKKRVAFNRLMDALTEVAANLKNS